MLDHPNIRVETNVDFFAERQELESLRPRLVYSGKIDEFFDYRFGELDYRSLRFQTTRLSGDFQGAPIVNYADRNVPLHASSSTSISPCARLNARSSLSSIRRRIANAASRSTPVRD